ncbi:MAG: 50S ribosome-binding GTPase [Lachnospiraceae bacterium]|nr:50S ribosome-binding GTPase [Lachnospiraceae bacterium]MDY4840570.1 GTPase [Lachnospiraceae bacterium]
MGDQKKQDFASRLNAIAKKIEAFVDEEFPDSSVYFSDKIDDGVISLLNVDKPKVMVYGIYNSGKSTLINALCEKEVAEMADRPMTDQISEYDRGEYYLVDSPGVDAPIEHEMVTEEYLNKCHVILFVISSKGMFEDRANYQKLAKLVNKDIPFIIILNDRGAAIDKSWSDEEKKKARFEHEQELKVIQYKIIQNLIKESNNSKIAEKYEVIILNAKKALTGILKEKPKLYAASGVDFLEKRIKQLINNDASIAKLFKQPIANLKECLAEIEKIITQSMSGNSLEDFGIKVSVIESKEENLLRDIKITTRQAVYSHSDELTNAYINGDYEIFEGVANTVFRDVENLYADYTNQLVSYVKRNFKNYNLDIDTMSNIDFDPYSIKVRENVGFHEETEENQWEDSPQVGEFQSFFNHFKSRKRREKEKRERLESEARIKNEYAQYKMQEQIRKKQEARQAVACDLDDLCRFILKAVTTSMNDRYYNIISQIQQIDCINKQHLDDGKRQMKMIKEIRDNLIKVENEMV